MSDRAADLAGLLSDLSADDDFVTAAVRAAGASGRPETALPEHEIRRHVLSLLGAVIAMLRESSDDMISAAVGADDLAVDRARQGVSLDVLLDAVQSARFVMLEVIIERASTLMPADELLTLLTRLDKASMILQHRMILTYQRAERSLSRTRSHLQVEALRELLDGGPLSWADEADLDRASTYHCLVVDVSAPSESHRIESAIDVGEGISGLVHGYLCRISTRLPGQDRLDKVLAVASPPVGLDRLASTYSLCREVLTAHRAEGRTGLQALTKDGFAVATAARPEFGRLLCEELLPDLNPEDDFHRLLARTMVTYLGAGGRGDKAAQQLHVHVNTVKYRIRRFNELTGYPRQKHADDTTLASSLNWWWALSWWLASAS